MERTSKTNPLRGKNAKEWASCDWNILRRSTGKGRKQRKNGKGKKSLKKVKQEKTKTTTNQNPQKEK